MHLIDCRVKMRTLWVGKLVSVAGGRERSFMAAMLVIPRRVKSRHAIA
jgi:hypothetical protein